MKRKPRQHRPKKSLGQYFLVDGNLQRKIVENARDLASALQRRGVRLACGGTDTHLLLIDLNAIETKSGYPL